MAENIPQSRAVAGRAGLIAGSAALAGIGDRARRNGTVTAAILAAEMPGWKLASDVGTMAPSVEDGMKSERGPSLAQLRRKFLGDDAADAPDDAGDMLGELDTSVETVRIQPRKGGPAKTADIKNGKVSIVQG